MTSGPHTGDPGDFATARSSDRPLVLLVDDFDDSRELYAEYLDSSGFQVEESGDGNDALRKAFALLPDLIVMDLTLPGLDGWAAIEQLKSDERTRHIPVLAVSGHAQRRRSDPEPPWDGYLTKPCLPEDLLQHVKQLLER